MSGDYLNSDSVPLLPRLCGADIELGNFIRGVDRPDGTGFEASRALLAEISGYPKRHDGYPGNLWSIAKSRIDSGVRGDTGDWASTRSYGVNFQDVGRRFLASNGSCAYIDLNHLELAIPEVISAYDHVAAWHAMLRIARAALDQANAFRDEENRIQILVNNTDGLGSSSYGSHLNFLISRRTFDSIFWRRLHYLQFLASFQVSAILLTGQGKVGAENARKETSYQISQRADFFEVVQGIQTTFNRPIVNSRDESLCGKPQIEDPLGPARLHVIFFDSALAHGSALFRVGLMQLMLTLIERDYVNPRLILEDPLAAVLAYSHDPTLRASARLIHGERVTALDLQNAYLDWVKHYSAQGVFDGVVPRAEEIIALWENTLIKFGHRDLMALAPRLDWVRKLALIERTMEQNPKLNWKSPEAKVIDHMYSSLDSDGLYWAYESSRQMERHVSEEEIVRFVVDPPSDTRAWTRAMLLRRAAEEDVDVHLADWDSLTFRMRGSNGWPVYRTIALPDPLALAKVEAEPIFDSSENFAELLNRLQEIANIPRPLALTSAVN